MAPMRVGVLAVQGNFREHAAMLRTLGADVVEVRLPEQLEGLDGLVIPGGESTAITRLMPEAAPDTIATLPSNSPVATVRLLEFHSRVQRVSEPVAEPVDRQDDDHDGEAGERG